MQKVERLQCETGERKSDEYFLMRQSDIDVEMFFEVDLKLAVAERQKGVQGATASRCRD